MSTPNKKPPAFVKNRRKSKWARGDVQLKIILITFFVAMVVLLVNLQFSVIGLRSLYHNPASTVEAIFEQTQAMLLRQFFVASLVTFPLAIWVGLTYFFRVCGPIYRFKLHFTNLETGRWDAPCTLRDKDYFVDIKDSINVGLSLVTDKVKRQNAVLRQAQSVLQRLGESCGEEERVQIQSVLGSIAVEHAEFAKRFGASEEETSESEPVAVASEAE